MWLGRTDRWSRSEGDRVIKVKLSNHLVHLVWIMSHSCCTTIFAEKEELNDKMWAKMQCEDSRLKIHVPMNLITYCCSLHGGTQCVHASDCTFFHHHCSHFTFPCNCPLRASHFQSGWSCSWVEGLCWRTPLVGICTSFHELMHYTLQQWWSWHMQAKYLFTYMYTHANWRVLLLLVLLCLK